MPCCPLGEARSYCKNTAVYPRIVSYQASKLITFMMIREWLSNPREGSEGKLPIPAVDSLILLYVSQLAHNKLELDIL